MDNFMLPPPPKLYFREGERVKIQLDDWQVLLLDCVGDVLLADLHSYHEAISIVRKYNLNLISVRRMTDESDVTLSLVE